MSLKDEEYLNLLKQDKSVAINAQISANLNAIVQVLINNNLITDEEYSELYEKSEGTIYKSILNNLSQQQKNILESNKIFNDLFGGCLNENNIFRFIK